MRFGLLGALGAASVAVVVGTACSDQSPSSSSLPEVGVQQQAIQGGVDDTTNRYAVGLCRSGFAGRCTAKCSGALILPNLIATARHCVSESPESIDCSSENPSFGADKGGTLVITTNATMSTGGTVDANNSGWYSVKSIAKPADAHLCGNDIALVTLNKPVPATEAKPIIPGVEYIMWDPAADYVLSFAAIGYGLTSPSQQPDTAGTRRRKEPISVICIPEAGQRECPDDAKIPLGEFVGGDGICSGDSGSSAYELKSFKATGGTPVSFGVLSRGGQSGTSCKGSVYTRFDQHREWVVDIAKQASANWTLYAEPSWTKLKPAPPKAPAQTKDAGASTKDPVGFGEECKANSDCTTKMCVDSGDGATFICSKICDANKENACPNGYSCVDSQCLKGADAPAETPVAPTTTTTTTEGCSSSGSGGTTSSTWMLAAFGLAGLAAARRRKS